MENETFVGPADWIRFVWTLKRSRFISCEKDFAARYRQTYPQFFSGKPRIGNGIILTLQKFRNWATERGMTPMLHAGTLLDVQTHFIGDNQLRIGEENLNDILESNTVMMAFFDRDGLDI
ncbi:hypothetical protein WUBG_16203, partial [Wuchereria bancrofti]